MITLVLIADCHVKHNVVFENLTESESTGIRKLAAKHGYKVAVRRPKQPTCDNCGNMTIRQTGSGNHRHCDLMDLYIPDNEMFPSCSYHTALMKFQARYSGRARLQNTIRTKGGAA